MADSALIDDLEKQFADNPRRVFARLANEYRKAGDAERAIEICRHHVPQQPGYISGHIVLGQALFDTGQFDEARGAFETALGLDPENLIALRQLGDIARETGDLDGAGSWYRRLLEVDPQNEEVAEQLQALDAAIPPLPAGEQGAASDDQEQVRWGDIHPEDVPREVEGVQGEAPDDAPSDSTPLPFIALDPESEAGAVVENAASGDDGAALPTSTEGEAATMPASVDAEIVLDTSAIQDAAPSAAPEPPVIDVEALAPAIDMAAPAAAEGETGEPEAVPTSPAGEADEQAFTSSAADSSAADGEPIAGEGESSDSATGDAFVTETMAELYVRQGFIEKALDIYRQLARQSPDEPRFQSAVEELEQVLAAGAGQGLAAMEEYDALAGAPTSVGPTIREFLSGIATRRATVRANGSASGPVSGGMASADTISRDDDGPGDADTTAYPAAHHDDRPGASAVYDVDRTAVHDVHRTADHDLDHAVATLPNGRVAPDDELFPGRQVSPHDDAAADALASGYLNGNGAEDGRRGAPARAAADELSLDAVFRSTPSGHGDGQRESSVSFDEFFANGTPASDDGVPPLNGDGPSAGSTGAPSDLELFHAWLEGLKK